jgi:hypothetical protein
MAASAAIEISLEGRQPFGLTFGIMA